jgi:hypothetical protein
MPRQRAIPPEQEPQKAISGDTPTEDDTEGHRGRALTEEPVPEEAVKIRHAIPDEDADKPGPDEAGKFKY